MAKKDKKKPPRIHPDTKNSLFAVLLFGLSIVLLLAAFEKAGPVGRFLYLVLENLFGWGYYLLPTIAALVGLLFIFSKHKVFVSTAIIGSVLFIVSGLGLIDLISDGSGGLVGKGIGLLEVPFGYTASVIISAVLMVASLLITFNASIKFKKVDKSELKKEVVEKPAKKEVVFAELKKDEAEVAGGEEEEEEIDEEEDLPEEEEDLNIVSGDQPRTATKAPKLKSFTNYVAPPLSLLKSSVEKPTAGDLRGNANIIKRTLDSFGIPVEMGEINIGPKVTRYTLKPAQGVKLSRIVALNPDLALALAAHPIRIEAPIPGKSFVGIEVPNKSAAVVRLGSLLSYTDFKESGPLSFVMGRDVSGGLIMADIEKMPHLLVAGSTGSGKSVSIHALLISLLYKNSPATLRLALIDPKRVELSVYKDVPHLIAPVITEGKKTIGLFRWAIKEMERRYEILLEAGARDIRSYNQKSSQPLPYLLLVVDELADLMASYGKEIESSIVRLAQMARATGIHLVVSTQRPSVEVITGLIKANINARVALQVASQIDSRTILDMGGAEKLLGGGDMLFLSSDFSKPKRIQGAYVTEDEIKKVADYIADNNESADWVEGIDSSVPLPMKAGDSSDFLEDLGGEDGSDDQLFDQAVKVVSEAQKASASLLQRRLKVGYARAARLLDLMEEKSLIGPGEGAKPREVFINKENGDTV